MDDGGGGEAMRGLELRIRTLEATVATSRRRTVFSLVIAGLAAIVGVGAMAITSVRTGATATPAATRGTAGGPEMSAARAESAALRSESAAARVESAAARAEVAAQKAEQIFLKLQHE
jgi:hypothetical protein